MQMEDYDLFPYDAADVPVQELASAMKWMIRDRLDFPLDDAVVDCFFIPNPIRISLVRKVYVIAARKELIQRSLDIARRARLNIQAIEVVELALNNVAVYLPEGRDGVALLYYPPFGDAGCLIVAKENKLYLARRVSAISQEARELGIDSTEEIAREVQRSLDYVEANFTQTPVAALYLASMPDLEPVLRDGLSGRLNVRVKMLRVAALFEMDVTMDQALSHRCLPALGEALRPLDKEA